MEQPSVSSGPPVVDMHTHFIPPEFRAADRHPAWGARVEKKEGQEWVVHEQGFSYPLDPRFLCDDSKIEDMELRGIDVSLISLSPTLFYYWIDPTEGADFARLANDSLAAAVQDRNGRLAGIASLPMQDPVAAAKELDRAVTTLGLAGAQVGTTVEGRFIDSEDYLPLWECAVGLEVPIILHPYYVGPKEGYEDYYLTNIFFNPLDTALSASRLIFSGVFDRFPALKIVLVHAGGFLPYQIGRLDHGWRVREEPKARSISLPSEYLGRLYFDTITHNDHALTWLIDFVGEDHVMLGTDLPFDMADEDPVGRVARSCSSTEGRPRVMGQNAIELFGLADTIPRSLDRTQDLSGISLPLSGKGRLLP